MANSATSSTERFGIVQEDLLRAFNMQRDFAIDALRSVIRSAESSIAQLDGGQFAYTDFVSQYSDKYAAAIAKMETINSAIAAFQWIENGE